MNSIINLPIFPLNGVIFFPNTNLPLNVFENKYIEMINYSLSSDKYIGMIQTKENGQLYKVGCVGKINSYEETADGHYLINLLGKNYFSILSEKKTTTEFRLIEAKIHKSNNTHTQKKVYNINEGFKKKLIQKFTEFTKTSSSNIDINLLGKIDLSTIVKFIAMSSSFSVADKQMLLETYNVEDLAKKLFTLFNYYSAISKNSETIN